MPPRKPAASSTSFASSSKPTKRGKFDDPDPELDDIAGGAAGGEEEDLEEAKGRRDGVKQEGYDSDSSDDGEGVVPSRKAKPTADGMDSDEDMFSNEPAKPTAAEAKKDKDKPKFLSLGEIEGQEFGAGDDGGAESDDSKDGMGYELSSFNMKSELREGAFTEEGAYVTNDKDRMEVHDRWMEGVDTKAAMRAAREAKKKRDEAEEAKGKRDVDELREGGGREELVREIVGMLQEGETVVGGLKRLGGGMDKKEGNAASGGKKLTWAERQKERKRAQAEAAAAAAGGMEVDGSASGSSTVSPFDRLSTLTADLTALGQLDLYSMTKEALQRLLPPPPAATRPPPSASSSSASAGPPPSADDGSQYEYRYTMDYIKSLPEGEKPVEREVFGPFPKSSILQWRTQGFFGGVGGAMEKVELRKVGGESPDWLVFWSLFG